MPPTPFTTTSLYEATKAEDGSGAVLRGAPLTPAQAIAHRRNGGDVVVCGPNPFDNSRDARAVEAAVGSERFHAPHRDTAGPLALPHWQQRVPPPEGHTFFELPNSKAIVTS
jgi:hypothetical protein